MKELLFKGSACALVTPFQSAEKEVDLSKFEELVRFQIANGTQALVVCGTTGEAATLSYAERASCVRCAVRASQGRVPVIAGTGSNNTEAAVRLSNDAEKEGVDGLLIVTPFYNKASQEGIVKHYEYISERVSSPIIVYNVPSRTGVDIKPETYAEIAKIKKVAGLKEANGNISALAKTIALCKGQLPVYSGNDDQTVPMMALGAVGVISVAANILPETIRTLTELCLNQEYRKAAALQVELCELEEALFSDVNPIPIKALMKLCNLCEDTVRLPLTPCSASCMQRLKSIAEKM